MGKTEEMKEEKIESYTDREARQVKAPHLSRCKTKTDRQNTSALWHFRPVPRFAFAPVAHGHILHNTTIIPTTTKKIEAKT